jgi:excisionase family DNA binding protein
MGRDLARPGRIGPHRPGLRGARLHVDPGGARPVSTLLTIDEVAERLRVGKRTVERWVAEGEIASVKMGRRRLVQETELERYLRLAQKRGRVA